MRLLAFVLVAGCSGSSITVTAKVTTIWGEPISGASLVFVDGDGTTHTHATDDTGSVTAHVASDGSIWQNRFLSDPNEGADYFVFADLEDGDTVVFSRVVGDPPPAVATMSIVTNAPAHSPDEVVHITSNCGYSMVGGGFGFIERCHGTADILVSLTTQNGHDLQYAFLPATPIIDGGTIAVDPAAWRPADQVSIALSTPDVQPLAIRNDFGGSLAPFPPPTAATLSGALALVGPELCMDFGSTQGTYGTVAVPLQATQTVNVAPLLLPTPTITDRTWSVDSSADLSGAWLVRHYGWQLPSPTGGARIDVHVFSDRSEPGAIPDVHVPDSQYKPIGSLIDRRVRLLRFGDLDRAGVLANIDDLASDRFTFLRPCLPTTSVASSGS